MTVKVWPRHLYSVPHAGKIGYCAKGSRAWFAAHDICWSKFIAEGVSAEVLSATGDPLALALVAHAIKESENGR